MRKFMLTAALVLVSATAQAGATRGLTLASSDPPAAAEQLKSAEAPEAVEATKPAEAPELVERPAAVGHTEVPKADAAKSLAGKSARPLRAEKPRRKRESAEARVVYELHRHGIYW